MLLTVELVPETAWFKNLRFEVSPLHWDEIRTKCYVAAGWKCEVCGGKGPKWPVECHEVWTYNDVTWVQKLKGMVALCPSCHEVKHIGLAEVNGRWSEALDHMCKVNQWDRKDAAVYIKNCFAKWRRRSQHEWELDLESLKEIMDGLKERNKTR